MGITSEQSLPEGAQRLMRKAVGIVNKMNKVTDIRLSDPGKDYFSATVSYTDGELIKVGLSGAERQGKMIQTYNHAVSKADRNEDLIRVMAGRVDSIVLSHSKPHYLHCPIALEDSVFATVEFIYQDNEAAEVFMRVPFGIVGDDEDTDSYLPMTRLDGPWVSVGMVTLPMSLTDVRSLVVEYIKSVPYLPEHDDDQSIDFFGECQNNMHDQEHYLNWRKELTKPGARFVDKYTVLTTGQCMMCKGLKDVFSAAVPRVDSKSILGIDMATGNIAFKGGDGNITFHTEAYDPEKYDARRNVDAAIMQAARIPSSYVSNIRGGIVT